MEIKNYKTVEDRPELTKEQIMAGMNFTIVANMAPLPKSMPLNILIVAGLTSIVIFSGIFVYLSTKTTISIQNNKTTVDSVAKAIRIPAIERMPPLKIPVVQPQKNQTVLDTV